MNTVLERKFSATNSTFLPLQTNTLIGKIIVYLATYNQDQKLFNFVSDLLEMEDVNDYNSVFCVVIKHL